MQYSPKFLKKALQTPTIVAMLGSLSFHGVLFLTSDFQPTKVQPERLQIVSIAPRDLAKTPTGRPLQSAPVTVPNGLRALNLDPIPKSWKFPDLNKASSSTKALSGSSSTLIDLNKIRTTNSPFRSLMEMTQPSGEGLTLSKSSKTFQPPASAIFPKTVPLKNVKLPQPNAEDTTVSENSAISPSPLPIPSGTDLDLHPFSSSESITPTPLSSPESSNEPQSVTSPNLPSPEPLSSETWSVFRQWLRGHSIRNVQAVRAEMGPTLTAVYPPEACKSRLQGTAVIAAVYGPDGNITSGSDSIRVLEPAPMLELTQAARAAVSKYHPPAGEDYQAYAFTVNVPYSSAVCQTGS